MFGRDPVGVITIIVLFGLLGSLFVWLWWKGLFKTLKFTGYFIWVAIIVVIIIAVLMLLQRQRIANFIMGAMKRDEPLSVPEAIKAWQEYLDEHAHETPKIQGIGSTIYSGKDDNEELVWIGTVMFENADIKTLTLPLERGKSYIRKGFFKLSEYHKYLKPEEQKRFSPKMPTQQPFPFGQNGILDDPSGLLTFAAGRASAQAAQDKKEKAEAETEEKEKEEKK